MRCSFQNPVAIVHFTVCILLIWWSSNKRRATTTTLVASGALLFYHTPKHVIFTSLFGTAPESTKTSRQLFLLFIDKLFAQSNLLLVAKRHIYGQIRHNGCKANGQTNCSQQIYLCMRSLVWDEEFERGCGSLCAICS